MKKDIEDLKKELVVEIKALAADIASSNSYVGLLANEIKFRSLQEKFVNLKFLERKQYGLEIFESDQSYQDVIANEAFINDFAIEEDPELDIGLKSDIITAQDDTNASLVDDGDDMIDESFVEEIIESSSYETVVPEEDQVESSSLGPLQLDFNDQLAFQYQLFDGDSESMDMVIRTLNAIHSLADSKKYLADLQREMQWENKEEYVERLEELVIKRFE